MRHVHRLLCLALLAAPATLVAAGCGGDDSSSGGDDAGADTSTTNLDASVPDTSTPDAGFDAGFDAGTVEAKALPAWAYLGHALEVDGSSSTGPGTLSYAWTVVSAPPGSAIATASLTGKDTAKASFVPDKVGAYQLELTVTSGAKSAKATVAATAVDPPVFYMQTEDDASAPEYTARVQVAGATEGDGGAVSCFATDGGSYSSRVSDVSKAGADWWEAPAGQPSRMAFLLEASEDGGTTSTLYATTSDATCAKPPRKIEALPVANNMRPIEQPAFSPSGKRIAYIRNAGDGSRIVTVGFDGMNRHVLAPTFAFADGGADPDAGEQENVPPAPRPVWIDETTVAWMQSVGANWQILSATDSATPTVTVLMTCTGATPSQFDVLPGNEIIVSQQVVDGGVGSQEIVVYPITAGTKACGAARDVSKLAASGKGGGGGIGAYARDFALSPDKKRVAYQAFDSVANTSELVVAAVDGATAPVSIAAPVAQANRGPRWVGGGLYLTWGLAATAFDASVPGNAVAVVSADGGEAHAVATAPDGGSVQAIGHTWFCSYSPVAGGGLGAMSLAGLLGMALARRRRDRRG